MERGRLDRKETPTEYVTYVQHGPIELTRGGGGVYFILRLGYYYFRYLSPVRKGSLNIVHESGRLKHTVR